MKRPPLQVPRAVCVGWAIASGTLRRAPRRAATGSAPGTWRGRAVGQGEVRVLDDADDLARGRREGPEPDALADLVDLGPHLGAELQQPPRRRVGVGHAPVRRRAVLDRGVADEAELVAADLEAGVEGLVEVRPVAQQLGEPRL